MKKRPLKLESKYILGIFMVGICCFIILGYLIYHQVSLMMINQCKDDAMGLAQVAASHINGDDFENIRSTDCKEYEETYEILDRYSNSNLISYIYAMRKQSNHMVFVIDTDKENPAYFEEYYDILDDMQPALEGKTCADQELTGDKWGNYFSAYSPIFSSKGRVVGIVGCDILMTDIEKMLSNLRILIISFLSAFAVALLLVYVQISEELMMRDMVTELPSVDKLLKKERRQKGKKQWGDCVGIQINIKDFKYINQQTGTENGDAILRQYAIVLKKNLSHGEMIVSLGGDRFFAIIHKEHVDEYLKTISYINMTALLPSISTGNNPIFIMIRAGLCPVEDNSMRQVMNKCSMAIGEAKKSGEDVVWFTPAMLEEMVSEKEILKSFEKGIKNNEFVVYYQPKISPKDNSLKGAEALCRWMRDGKMVPPGEFIPVLEKNGKVTELDFYVFEQVCRDIRKWMNQGLTPVRISTNFSKKHLDNPLFAKRIEDIIKRYEIPARYLETELTEASGYSDQKVLTAFLSDMRENGICTSMDDFGTGYSSLSLLKELPFDIIKMDRSFFIDMEDENPKTLKMIENLIHLIHDLDRLVVCEGIESQKQIAILRTMGSPLIQGYVYDKPLPHDEFEKRLQNPIYS